MSLNLSFGGKLNKDKVLQQLEKDIKSLSKNLGVELEKVSLKDVDKATSQIQKQINQLSKNINLNISKISLGNNGTLQDIQQQINSALKGEKINLEVKNNIKEISSEFDVLDNKLKNSFLKQEQYLSQLENRLNKIKERSVTQHTKNENYDNSRDLNSIQNIQNRINEIKSKNIRLSQEEKNIMQQQLIELDAYIKKESSKSAEINRSTRFLTSQLRTLENLKVRVDNRGGKSSEQVRISNELEKQINLYKQLIAQNEILGSVERNRIQKNVNDLKVQSRELVTTSQFSNIFARMKDYFIGSSIIGASIGVLKEGFSTIVEVDNSMRDLKKVTNEVSQEYESFENQANDMAKALGNQTKNVIEATAAFAQMSYSYQESKELAQNSIIFSNVGDIDSESANKGLIATMKAYNIQAKDSMDIIDKLNNVSNHFSVSVGGLNSAIMRGGSALSTANNDLSQSIALITTANSAIQDQYKQGRVK
ncbi:phage tail tape measure protein [Clostridium perfringens]|uniref:phage tail tape measure protein n=1 Tax=Clostridium perfringens TaxID=1502 RepID=UPI001ABADC1A|nr:phage tail tape measure protein [Clostridium perfringens]MBO3398437.1 phage tail tape measure protein [Clostridium perfringens]